MHLYQSTVDWSSNFWEVCVLDCFRFFHFSSAKFIYRVTSAEYLNSSIQCPPFVSFFSRRQACVAFPSLDLGGKRQRQRAQPDPERRRRWEDVALE